VKEVEELEDVTEGLGLGVGAEVGEEEVGDFGGRFGKEPVGLSFELGELIGAGDMVFGVEGGGFA
jgi:hypothetical protein